MTRQRAFLPLLLLAATARAADLHITPQPNATNPTQYEISEWLIDPNTTYHNPFNPSEIAIDAHFTGPNNTTLTLPAFWDGPNQFVLRFSPPLPGDWSLTITAKDASGTRTTHPIPFTAQPATNNPGFLRRASNHNKNRYFVTDSGKTAFLLGLNLAWSPHNDPAEYDAWFASLQNAGGNYARLWFNHAFPLETNKLPLGQYDLAAAKFYDHIFQSAAQHHIYLMLTLNNYRELIGGDFFGDADWPKSPYNLKNGGPLDDPMHFFTDRRVQLLYHQRLRYLVGRYSAYTSLAFWEFWNEQDHLPDPGLPTEWLKTQSITLASLDPYQHPLTTSYSWKDRDDVWNLPAMDLTQRHMYGIGDKPDFTQEIIKDAARYATYNKPHLIGEFGINWKESDIRHDPRGTGIAFHNAIWASALSGNAGSAATWWWDNYFIPKNLWHIFTGLSVYLKDVDLAAAHYQTTTLDAPGTETVAMQDEQTGAILAWLHDPASNWQNDLAEKEPAEMKTIIVQVKLPKGDFHAAWIGTNTGKVMETKDLVSAGTETSLAVPAFTRDIALRITPAR